MELPSSRPVEGCPATRSVNRRPLVPVVSRRTRPAVVSRTIRPGSRVFPSLPGPSMVWGYRSVRRPPMGPIVANSYPARKVGSPMKPPSSGMGCNVIVLDNWMMPDNPIVKRSVGIAVTWTSCWAIKARAGGGTPGAWMPLPVVQYLLQSYYKQISTNSKRRNTKITYHKKERKKEKKRNTWQSILMSINFYVRVLWTIHN